MQLRYQIEYSLTAGMLAICRKIPRKGVIHLFKSFGSTMYYLLGSRRKLTLSNLEIAFPEKSLKERKQLAKQCFVDLSDSMAFNTLVISGRISNEELLQTVETEGWEHYEKALSLTDMGLLIFSAHIGNWELLPQFAALRTENNIHAVARKVTNPLLEEKLIGPFRKRFGVNVFYKKNALRRIIKAVRRGEHAGLLIDQRLREKSGGIPVAFFGKTAPTIPSTAFLQIRYGVVVLPAFMIKTENGKYRLIIKEPIQWEDNGKEMDEQVAELTRIHQSIIEDIIRKHPTQWFWMHDRWDLARNRS